MSAPDAVVVGGGAIGLGIAWRSAQRGLSVVVVDDAPARSASWAAAGMLAPVTEVHPGEEGLLRLNLASARIYSKWVDELQETTGRDVGYRRSGTLMVARDADENSQLAEVHDLQRTLGLDARRLRGRECRALEPGLNPTVRGGIEIPEDHQVDNRALVEALSEACRLTGVRFVRDRVETVVGSSRVEGVSLNEGERIACDTVVLAAGAWSKRLGGLARSGLPPVRAVKGQLLHLRMSRHSLPVDHVIRGVDVYLVPRGDGRVIVGATVEEQGFDTTVTAGGVYTLLRDAYEIVPGIAEAELTEAIASLRPATPDNSPALGPTSVPGLVVATGHFRNGILLTPITADAIATYLTEGREDPRIRSFTPLRFESERAAS